MSISGISGSANTFNASAVKSKADESLQQLAQQGDQTAIAELKQIQVAENPQPQAGASEPGKGQEIDQYL